jgi:serine/threonine-protein kinase
VQFVFFVVAFISTIHEGTRLQIHEFVMIEKLGPYRIERILGRGGMGTVYAGVHEETQDSAALKVLSFALLDDGNFRSRFIAEIETLKKLRHPHIVQLYGDGEHDGNLYYVMELVEGRTLQEELQSGRRFDWSEVVDIAIQVCQALKHAHDRGIIHRDLKPANLLLTPEGQIKLSDFGIARLFGGSQLTADGSVVGTADYMAPEQAEGRPVTNRTDLYSLGAVMFTLLARKPPFVAPSLPQIIHKLRYEEAPNVRRFAPDVPAELEQLIHELLDKDPAKRVPTALALNNRLRALQHGLSRITDRDMELHDSQVPSSTAEEDEAATRIVEMNMGSPTEVGPTAIESDNDVKSPGDDAAVQATLITSNEASGSSAPQESSSPTVADEAPSPKNRYTLALELEQQAYEKTKEDRPATSQERLQIVVMIIALITIIAAITWAVWPLSADRLHEQIIRVSQDRGAEAAKDDIDQFLDRFPNDPRVAEIDAMRMDVECEWLQKRLALTDLQSGGSKLEPWEADLLAAMRLRVQDPEAAEEALAEFAASYENVADAAPSMVECLQAARHLLKRMQEAAEAS